MNMKIDSNAKLSNKEKEVIEKLADTWNLFMELGNFHVNEQHEFNHLIHQAQYMIMARPFRD